MLTDGAEFLAESKDFEMFLKINRSMPCHKPSMGVARSGLWTPSGINQFIHESCAYHVQIREL